MCAGDSRNHLQLAVRSAVGGAKNCGMIGEPRLAKSLFLRLHAHERTIAVSQILNIQVSKTFRLFMHHASAIWCPSMVGCGGTKGLFPSFPADPVTRVSNINTLF